MLDPLSANKELRWAQIPSGHQLRGHTARRVQGRQEARFLGAHRSDQPLGHSFTQQTAPELGFGHDFCPPAHWSLVTSGLRVGTRSSLPQWEGRLTSAHGGRSGRAQSPVRAQSVQPEQ